MIISRLSEGLGNQLFQYAIGRSLSIQKGTSLRLDISFYSSEVNTKIQRRYVLDKFNISAEIASSEDIQYVLNKKDLIRGILRYLFKQNIPYYKEKQVIEKSLFYDNNIFRVNKNVLLSGYWPNEKYFLSINKIIRNDLRLRNEYLTKRFQMCQNQIIDNQSISIHIRRADYLDKSNGTFDIFGICDLNYYYNAILFIQKRVIKPNYFIFTDDVLWVQKNVKFQVPYEIISGTGLQDYEELILMSNCKHNIIANSTFSWWGAWLNENVNKIVISPKKWYNGKAHQEFYDNSDFVPNSWIRL